MSASTADLLSRLARGLGSVAEHRLRLLQSELGEETQRLGRLLALQLLIALLGLLTLQFAALVVLAMAWDTAWRVPALVGLLVLAASGTALAYTRYTSRKQRKHPLFAASLEELRKDRAALEQALEPTPDAPPQRAHPPTATPRH